MLRPALRPCASFFAVARCAWRAASRRRGRRFASPDPLGYAFAMRHPIPFDAHAFVKRLAAAGVPEAQAEIHAQVFAEVVVENLATKEDLLTSEQRLRSDIRADMKDLELRLTLRFGTMLAAAVAIVVAVQKPL
jgi:hypothetical protein